MIPPINFAYVIDDNPLSNAVLAKTLTNHGFAKSILSSTSADNALNFLIQLRDQDKVFPEIIFLDLSMPGMDGWEFIEKFYSTFGKDCPTRIVIVSATQRWTDWVKFEMREEIADFIKKPVTTMELESVFTRLAV